MTKKSDEFEQLITEIKKLLFQEKADIKWNQSIKDPDTPNQTRQIDILIKEDNHVTHVECRIHKDPQDVKWVEELMGRKTSLKADAIIGVSSSGFTQPAIRKARNHGIILRDLRSISRGEIEAWGKGFKASVEYMHFENIIFELYTKDRTSDVSTDAKDLQDFLQEHHSALKNILKPLDDFIHERAGKQQKNNLPEDGKFKMEYNYTFYEPQKFKGILIHNIKVKIPALKSMFVDYFVSEVALYGPPDEQIDDRETSVQKLGETGWQLIDTPFKGSFTFDTTILQPPSNSILSGIKLTNLTPYKKYDITNKRPLAEDYYDKIENITVMIVYG